MVELASMACLALMADLALVVELALMVVVVAFFVVVAYLLGDLLDDLLAYLRAFVAVLHDACLARCGIVLVLSGYFGGEVLVLLSVVYHVE